MENTKQTGYILHDFMIEDMGLSGVALRVYALIYSFTKAGSDCHGSVEYIAKRTDSSTASVQRALNYLVKNNFVTKTKTSHKRPSIYVANYSSINHNDSIIKERINQNDRLIESKYECDSIMMIDNNKENNKEILTNYDIFDVS